MLGRIIREFGLGTTTMAFPFYPHDSASMILPLASVFRSHLAAYERLAGISED